MDTRRQPAAVSATVGNIMVSSIINHNWNLHFVPSLCTSLLFPSASLQRIGSPWSEHGASLLCSFMAFIGDLDALLYQKTSLPLRVR